jgi:hypothetical protein
MHVFVLINIQKLLAYMFPPKYFVFLAVLDEFLLTSVQFGRKKIRFEKSDKIVDTVTLKFPLVKLQPSSPQLTLAVLNDLR